MMTKSITEEELQILQAFRDPVKGPKLRKVMEDSLNG